MVVKYIAIDGAEFDNEIDCKKYEKDLELFTVEYIYADGGKKVYTGNGKNFDLTNFITASFAFRITAGYDVWNNYLKEEFSGLDDEIYYGYEIPTILEEQVNQWFSYTMFKDIKPFDVVMQEAKEYAQYLEEIKELL